MIFQQGETSRNPGSQIKILKRKDHFDIERPVFRDRLTWRQTGQFHSLNVLLDYFKHDPDVQKRFLREFL